MIGSATSGGSTSADATTIAIPQPIDRIWVAILR